MSWRTWLRLGRVSNLPTVWTNALAGMVLAGAALSLRDFLLLALAFSLFYEGGMLLNDAFDRKIDAAQRPDRPIPAGLVTVRAVFLVGFALLLAGLTVLLIVGGRERHLEALMSGVALAAVIVLYDVWHKGNPLSPLLMGLARALVYVGAAAAVTGTVPGPVIVGAGVLLAYLIGLTYTAKQESLGSVQNWWPLLFLAAPLVYGGPLLGSTAACVALYLGFLAWVGYALSLLARPPKRVPLAVVSLIAGISLVDAVLIALWGGPVLGWAAVGGFVLTLALQRVVPGT